MPGSGRVLLQSLRETTQIQLFDGCELERVRMAANSAQLHLSRHDEALLIHTHLLCLADGGDSPLAGQLGLHRATQDYGQSSTDCHG